LKISIINQWLKKDSLLDFFGHSVNCTKGIDASPHTNYLQTFKKRPGRWGSGGVPCGTRTFPRFSALASTLRLTAYRLKGGAL